VHSALYAFRRFHCSGSLFAEKVEQNKQFLKYQKMLDVL